MIDSESISHNQSSIPAAFDIHNKFIELNSTDLRDETANQDFFDYIFTIINNLCILFTDNNKEIEKIDDVFEEIFSFVFLLCENKNPQVLQLINPLFMLKSISKATLFSFFTFLNLLKKYFPDIDFNEKIKGYINSVKEILITAINHRTANEFINFNPNSKIYLTIKDSVICLSTIFFLTDKYVSKGKVLSIYGLIANTFIQEKKIPPFFVDFLSNCIKTGLCSEINSFFNKELIESLSNDTILFLFQNYQMLSPMMYECAYKIAKNSKYQPICNAILYSRIQLRKASKVKKDKSLIQILENCDIEQFNLEFWNDFADFENIYLNGTILERVVRKFNFESNLNEEKDVPLISVFAKLMESPHTLLSQEQCVQVLKHSNDFISINSLLTNNFNDNILVEPEFWWRYMQNYSERKLYMNGLKCFWHRYRQKQIRIADILFFQNTQPNENMCIFIKSFLSEIPEISIINDELNMIETVCQNVNSPLFPKFWDLFDNKQICDLYFNAPEEKKFIFYFGLSCTSEIYQIPFESIHFCKLTKASDEYLCSIISGQNKIDINHGLPDDIGIDLLYFISSTSLCKNLMRPNLIKTVIFSEGSDFFLFFALYIKICRESVSEYKILEGYCLNGPFEKAKEFINTEIGIRNINLLISIVIEKTSVQTDKINSNFLPLLSEVIDYIWTNFEKSDIFTLFPQFDEFAYQLHLCYLNDANYAVHQREGFPNQIDCEMLKMLFECYKKNPITNISSNNIPKQFNFTELMKNPTPQLFGFIKNCLCFNSGDFMQLNLDENAIISSFDNYFKISPEKNEKINELISSLSDEQVILIVKRLTKFLNFDSLTEVIEKNKATAEQQKSIVTIFPYINFIKKQVYKRIREVLNQKNHHELKEKIDVYLSNHQDVNINIKFNQNDKKYEILDNENEIPVYGLFDLDNILNTSMTTTEERLKECIPLLFKHTIYLLCNNEEVPDEIKKNLFLQQNEKENKETNNYLLEPTFESFSNLRNVVKYIFEDFLILQNQNELFQFLSEDQKKALESIIPIFNLTEIQELESQLYYIVNSCPAFKTTFFPITLILKMFLLGVKNEEIHNLLYNVINMKFCKGSTGVLHYINLIRSCTSHLKISKDDLMDILMTYSLCTPDSIDSLRSVISKLFVKANENDLFFLDIDISQLKMSSREDIQFVRTNLLKGPFTATYLSFLSSFLITYPELIASAFDQDECNFEDDEHAIDITTFIRRIVGSIKHASSYHILSQEFDTEHIIIVLLANFMRNPKLGDKVIQFIFENILSFNKDVILALLYSIRIACSFFSFQSIMVGYLIRYNFVEISHKIIEKLNLEDKCQTTISKIAPNYDKEKQQYEFITEIPPDTNRVIEYDFLNEEQENEELSNIKIIEKMDKIDEINRIKDEIIRSIMILFTLLIRYDVGERNGTHEIAMMISNQKNPILDLNNQFFCYSNDVDSQSRWSPSRLRAESRLLNFEQVTTFSFIQLGVQEELIYINMISSITSVPCNYRKPEDVPLEYFQELPSDLQCCLIIERIPRINGKITLEGYELLFNYPPWVMNWIVNRPTVTLLQQHYDIITDCINRINLMNSSSAMMESNGLNQVNFTSKESLKSASLLAQNSQIAEKFDSFVDYKRMCEFFAFTGPNQCPDYYILIYTLTLYLTKINKFGPSMPVRNDIDEIDRLKTPKEFLIYYARKIYKENHSLTSFCTLLSCFSPIAEDLLDTIINLACSSSLRRAPDIFEAILKIYKRKAFFKNGKINNKNSQNKQNNNDNDNNNIGTNPNSLRNDNIFSISYLLNNNNNSNNSINQNNTYLLDNIINNNNFNIANLFHNYDNDYRHNYLLEDSSEDYTSESDIEEDDDFSDVDEIYRFEFFVILTMCNSPKVLSLMLEFAPKRLIRAALKKSSCISNAFLRCIYSDNVEQYNDFFMELQYLKDFFVQHESVIIDRIRSLLPNWENNISQIVPLFGMLSYQTIEDPLKVCSECYEQLNPFWKLVFDARDLISKVLLDTPTLIDGDFRFMKPVVHTLSFSYRLKYFRMFLSGIVNQKTRTIIVSRDNILEDSYEAVMSLKPNEFLGHISVNFEGERGIDAGGLLRDWYTNLTKALFNENYALFVSSKVHGTFLPNQNSSINENHLRYFEFAGRIFARSLIDQVNLGPHLALTLLKKLLNRKLALDDIEEFDPALFKSLKWILETNLAENLRFEMFFTADSENIGQHEVYELIENGSKILVTDENKELFVQKTIEYRTDVAIQDQCCAFCSGFFSIIPARVIEIFTPEELDRMICGEPFIDVDDWMKNCIFVGQFSINHPTIVNFFNTIKKWDQSDIAKLLAFITGSPQVPLGGFAAYRDFGKPITISSVDERDKLITAHTCSNLLDLPVYETEAELNDKIRLAIQECNSFDFH